MQKFIIKIVLFFVIIAIIDVISGKSFAFLVEHAKGGENWRNNYICNKTNEDILVFGSSRAIHHYNPIILSDSLNLSCYNCGQNGNGVILNEARYQLILQRHKPKVIIYDVSLNFDLLTGEDNHKYLGWLRAYYDRKGIPEVFESVDETEKYKMISQMYRYNTKFFQIITENIHPLRSDGINGFRPVDKEMDTMKVSKTPISPQTPVYDSLKISYIKKMIAESDGTQIVFVVSPLWIGADTISYQPIREICKEKNLPYYDFSNNPKYVHHNEFFYDGVHMNARGADEFTKDLIIELKRQNVIKY